MTDLVTVLQHSPMDVFDHADLGVLLFGMSAAARHNKLSREVKQGNLIRLKRGVYALGKRYQRKGLHPFVVAHKLYFPSYISFESALSHYGLIPEAIPETTCATTKPSVQIQTPIGTYSYRWLPLHVFSSGVLHENKQGYVFLIASPLKALLDLVYVHKKQYTNLADIEADLRLNLPQLVALLSEETNKDIAALKHIYTRPHVDRVIDAILWELL